MQPILVTGLGGFVGRHVRAAVADTLPGVELVSLECDLCDRAAVRTRVEAVRPAACLHLAAIAAIGDARRDPDRAWTVNLHGTLALARAMLDVAPAAPFLFASSADAYGSSFRRGIVDEESGLAPMNDYGATKAAADLALGALAAEGFQAVRFRAFNHTGPGQGSGFAVPAFARQLAMIAAGRQEPVLRTGNLDSQRDFLDVRDVAHAYALVLRRAVESPDSLRGGLIFNVASGLGRRIQDVLDELVQLSGLTVTRELDPERMRPSDIPQAIGDARRLREAFGWVPRIPWAVTLSDVLTDWRERVRSG